LRTLRGRGSPVRDQSATPTHRAEVDAAISRAAEARKHAFATSSGEDDDFGFRAKIGEMAMKSEVSQKQEPKAVDDEAVFDMKRLFRDGSFIQKPRKHAESELLSIKLHREHN